MHMLTILSKSISCKQNVHLMVTNEAKWNRSPNLIVEYRDLDSTLIKVAILGHFWPFVK